MTMDTANTDVVVNVYTDGAKSQRRNLTNICVCSDGATFDNDVGTYASSGELDDDSAHLDAACIAFCKQFFAQDLHPPQLKIGKCTNYTSFETRLAALIDADPDIFAFVCEDRTKANLAEFGAACTSVDRIGLIQCGDAEILAGTGGNALNVLKTTLNSRVAGIYHDDDLVAADLAWLAYKLALSPDDGSCSFDKAALNGIDLAIGASVPITSTEWGFVLADNGNSCVQFGGVPVMRKGTLGNGQFIDQAISRMWAKIRVYEAIVDALLAKSARNENFAYNEHGIAELQGVALRTLQLGEPPQMQPGRAHFNKGSCFVNAPNYATISAAVKATRALPAFTCGAQFAGSIQSCTFNIYLAE
jgi:hypothetical protein